MSQPILAVVTPRRMLELLGYSVVVDPHTDGTRQVGRAMRDGSVVAVVLRDNEDEAVHALYKSITAKEPRVKRAR